MIEEDKKLKKIYENLGFKLADIQEENYRKTAFYQKKVGPLEKKDPFCLLEH